MTSKMSGVKRRTGMKEGDLESRRSSSDREADARATIARKVMMMERIRRAPKETRTAVKRRGKTRSQIIRRFARRDLERRTPRTSEGKR